MAVQENNNQNNTVCMLGLSTLHLTPDTLQRLIQGNFTWLVSYAKNDPATSENYGAFVCASSVNLEEEEDIQDIPDDLMETLRYANARGAQWVMFDRDETLDGKLPDYIDAWSE